jgi:2-iminobutanoate/2-iminopropanoate deaminase
MKQLQILMFGTFALMISGATTFPVVASANQIEHYTMPENVPLNLPFSEAVRVGHTIYLAGQIGIPPGGKAVVPGGIEPESKQTLTNIGLVLAHFNLTFENVVRCQVMLADISDWPKFNAMYKTFVKAPYPARSAFAGSGLAFNAKVEIECVAVVPDDDDSSRKQ